MFKEKRHIRILWSLAGFSLLILSLVFASNEVIFLKYDGIRNLQTESQLLLRFIPAGPATNIAEVEPNDQVAQAQVLTGISPLVVSGQAEVADQGELVVQFQDGSEDDLEDLYKITLTASGLKINLDGFNADCDLYLINESGSQILKASLNIGANSPEAIDLPALAIGKYLVAVSIFDPAPAGPTTTAYTLTISGEFEGTQPTPLNPPTNLMATVSGRTVNLSWDPPANGLNTITGNSPASPAKIDVDQSLRIIELVNRAAYQTKTTTPYMPTFPATNITEIEPNNKLAEAQVLAGESPLVVGGNAEVADQGELGAKFDDGSEDDFEDLYQVTTMTTGLKINLSGFNSDCDLWLLDQTGTQVLKASLNIGAGTAEEIDQPYLAAGTYIVAVTIFDPAPAGPNTTAYTLTLTGTFQEDSGQPPEILAYHIYRATTSPVQTTPPNKIGSVTGTETNYQDPNLQTGTTYYYVVTAVYATGESGPSNEAEALIADSQFHPPQDLTAVVTRGAIRLNWKAPASNGGGQTQENEMKFDDGAFESYIGFKNGTGTMANGPFIPTAYPATLKKIMFLTSGRRTGDNVNIKIYVDPTGAAPLPATNLLVGTVGPIAIGPANVLQEVDVTSAGVTLSAGSRFFVGIQQTTTENYALGFDENAADGNAFYAFSDGIFSTLASQGYHGVHAIRAVVEIPVTSMAATSGEPEFRPIFHNQSPEYSSDQSENQWVTIEKLAAPVFIDYQSQNDFNQRFLPPVDRFFYQNQNVIPLIPTEPATNITEIEPNNTLAAAQLLAGESPLVVSGNAEVADQGELSAQFQDGSQDDFEDLFKVTTTAAGLKINLSGFTSDCDLWLTDETGTQIIKASLNIGAKKPEEIDQPALEAGTYLVAVTIFDPAPGGPVTTAYTLTLTGAFQDGGGGPANLLAYRIYRSKTSPVEINEINRLVSVEANILTYVDTDYEFNVTYHYVVTAAYDFGESGPSNEASAMVPGGPKEEELKFDDNDFELALGLNGSGVMLNGPFIPSGFPAKIKQVKFVTNGSQAGESVQIQVYLDSSGTATRPSAEQLIFTTDSVVLTGGNTWQEVTLDLEVPDGGQFFIGIEQLKTTPCGLGFDLDAPNGNAFYAFAGGTFAQFPGSGVFAVRAIVEVPNPQSNSSPTGLMAQFKNSLTRSLDKNNAGIQDSEFVQSQLPDCYQLFQNYPNPFNPVTSIRFALPEAAQVKIMIYSMLGKQVAELVNQKFPAGVHLLNYQVSHLASGIYYYVMETDKFKAMKKMIILK